MSRALGNPRAKGRPKAPPPPPVVLSTTPSLKETSEVGNQLSLGWSKHLHVMIPGSLVYSPLFMRSMLSMAKLAAGTAAGEKTGDEISSALSLPLRSEDLESFCENLLNVESNFKKFNNPDTNCVFLESRSFWIKKGFEISPAFQEAFPRCFPTASFHQIEFSEPTVGASFINSWFSQVTANEVQNVVGPKDLTSFTRILLLDGVYFRGNWSVQFPLKNTKEMPFRITAKRSVEVSMMNRIGKFLYGEFPEIEAQGVAIPYHGDALYLAIILPAQGISLDKLRMRGIPQPILKSMKERILNLTLPRFSIESRLHLIPSLKQIGVKSMFDPTVADFSGVAGHVPGGSGLFVSDIIQGMKFEVNEGTPLAPQQKPSEPSSTSSSRHPELTSKFSGQGRIVTGDGGGGGKSQSVTVDHPFIFQVIHKGTGTLLIDGTCMDPSS